MEQEKILKSYLPMSEASFLLLSCLQSENHGYGIMQKVTAITSGRVNLGAGTVYTILYKMENDGLILAMGEFDRRKVYKITALGKMVLNAEANRILQLANLAQEIVSERPIAFV